MLNRRLLERLGARGAGVTLRSALPCDLYTAATLYCEKLREEEGLAITESIVDGALNAIRDAIGADGSTVILAEIEDVVVGMLWCKVESDDVGCGLKIVAGAIYVESGSRCRGVAERLIEGCVRIGEAAGATRLVFFHGPEGCSSFYRALGAEVYRLEYEIALGGSV